MRDNEIIKALKCCKRSYVKCNKDCPRYYGFYGNIPTCKNMLIKESLGLIKQQKSEIKRLQNYNENLQTANTALSNEILEIKSATIKEFAKRVKAYLHTDDFGTPDERWRPESEFAIGIDNLVKEMTEVNENDRA